MPLHVFTGKQQGGGGNDLGFVYWTPVTIGGGGTFTAKTFTSADFGAGSIEGFGTIFTFASATGFFRPPVSGLFREMAVQIILNSLDAAAIFFVQNLSLPLAPGITVPAAGGGLFVVDQLAPMVAGDPYTLAVIAPGVSAGSIRFELGIRLER